MRTMGIEIKREHESAFSDDLYSPFHYFFRYYLTERIT